jgi:hypothetical protein
MNGVIKKAGDPETDARLSRLAELRAERAALDAARLAREHERAIDEQIAAESIALDDARAIEKAEEAHGPVGKLIGVVHTPQGCVIVKRSNAMKFRRFQESEITAADVEKLVRPCVVYPDLPRFDALTDDLPALWHMCANEISVLAGIKRKEITGKS